MYLVHTMIVSHARPWFPSPVLMGSGGGRSGYKVVSKPSKAVITRRDLRPRLVRAVYYQVQTPDPCQSRAPGTTYKGQAALTAAGQGQHWPFTRPGLLRRPAPGGSPRPRSLPWPTGPVFHAPSALVCWSPLAPAAPPSATRTARSAFPESGRTSAPTASRPTRRQYSRTTLGRLRASTAPGP